MPSGRPAHQYRLTKISVQEANKLMTNASQRAVYWFIRTRELEKTAGVTQAELAEFCLQNPRTIGPAVRALVAAGVIE